MSTTTVRVTLSVTIDPEAWSATYGEQDDVRADVRQYILSMVHNSAAADEGGIVTAELR